MPGNYSVTTRASGSILTATIYNTDHGIHVTYATPGGLDDASATVSAMQAMADPGESGSESLPTDLLGEIHRLRHMVTEITGKTYWYQTPDSNLGSLFLKGADIALASTLVPVGEFEFADVTGSGINVTGLNTEAAGKRRKLRFQNAVNIIHSSTLQTPFAKIYRTYAGEFVTFESNGSGTWYISDYSGPHEAPGVGKEFMGASAPVGYVLQAGSAIAALSCTAYEGLFTEMVANLDQEGYTTPVGTITADNTNDTISKATHGLSDGDVVHFANSGGGLPGNIVAKTLYYVRDATAGTFKITATRGGAALDISSNGTGTNSVYNTFYTPDSRGRADIGKDDLGGTPANLVTSASTNGGNSTTLRGKGGAQTHTLVTGEMPAHTHNLTIATDVPPASGPGGATGNSASATTSSTGGGGAHSNTQPWRAVTKIVRV